MLLLVWSDNKMTNTIKQSGGGLALQVTKPARDAGLVEEGTDGDATYLADVLVYGFDDLVLIVDANRVDVGERAELVALAARDTDSIHQGVPASLEIAGNGYQVQLPGCRSAGFYEGDRAPMVSRHGMLLIHDGTQIRLVKDLATIREEKVGS